MMKYRPAWQNRIEFAAHFLLLSLTLACAGRVRPRFEAVPAAQQQQQQRSPSPADIMDYLRTRQLMVPVDGIRVSQVPDNFSSGRGGRAHNAHDLMAKRGTAVLAADDSRIIRLADNVLGGITIYATDPEERIVYYYAHLDRYAEGLKAGAKVSKGEVIGFVGSTGNASENAPHLHFQVAEITELSRHWEGIPIDARTYFVLDGQKK